LAVGEGEYGEWSDPLILSLQNGDASQRCAREKNAEEMEAVEHNERIEIDTFALLIKTIGST
jgi:hypothetical protein